MIPSMLASASDDGTVRIWGPSDSPTSGQCCNLSLACVLCWHNRSVLRGALLKMKKHNIFCLCERMNFFIAAWCRNVALGRFYYLNRVRVMNRFLKSASFVGRRRFQVQTKAST